jgi:hypothetical protein
MAAYKFNASRRQTGGGVAATIVCGASVTEPHHLETYVTADAVGNGWARLLFDL